MTETHGVSCEPCKKKKCKCDRNIPFCGQCSSSPLLCKYAENSKRGIPSGYLNALEQRLNETELALHKALSDLRSIKSGLRPDEDVPFISNSRQLPFKKGLRMQEWSSYPLETPKHLEAWRQAYTQGTLETTGQAPGPLINATSQAPAPLLDELMPISQPYPREDYAPASHMLPTDTQSHMMLSNQRPPVPILLPPPSTLSDHDKYAQPSESSYLSSRVVSRQQANAELAEEPSTGLLEEPTQGDPQLKRSQRISSLFHDTYY